MNETISSGDGEVSDKNIDGGDYAWDSLENTPFKGDEMSATENEDYFTFEGEEYRNLNKIDISTEHGKYEWLDALIENSITRKEAELEKAQADGYKQGDEVFDDLSAELNFGKRQQKILTERIRIDGEGGVVGALQREYVASHEYLSKLQNNGASQNAIDMAYEHYQASSNLLGLIESEISRREREIA